MIRYYLLLNFLFFSVIIILSTSNRGGYDHNTGQFDPTGRVLQLEYAKEAVKRKGIPIVAIRCNDGIILVGKKYLSSKSKLEARLPQKIFFVDNHICLGVTGLLFESKIIIEFAKKVCIDYKSVYGSSIPIENTRPVRVHDPSFGNTEDESHQKCYALNRN